MCIICTEWQKGKLNNKEAYNAVREIVVFSKNNKEIDHLLDLINKILDNPEEPGTIKE